MTDLHICTWWCAFWCYCRLHRWDYPGGPCVCCGVKDTFFDQTESRRRAKFHQRLDTKRDAQRDRGLREWD